MGRLAPPPLGNRQKLQDGRRAGRRAEPRIPPFCPAAYSAPWLHAGTGRRELRIVAWRMRLSAAMEDAGEFFRLRSVAACHEGQRSGFRALLIGFPKRILNMPAAAATGSLRRHMAKDMPLRWRIRQNGAGCRFCLDGSRNGSHVSLWAPSSHGIHSNIPMRIYKPWERR